MVKALGELKHGEGKHVLRENILRSFTTSLKIVNVNLGLAAALVIFSPPADRLKNNDHDRASSLILATAELAERDQRGWVM